MPKKTARAKPRRPTTDALEIMDRLWGHRPGHRAAVARELAKLHLGERIRDAREARGLTQAQLATLVGTTQSGIARLEAAEYTNFKLDTLLKIAAALRGRVSLQFPAVRIPAKVQG
jgi:ribosome-binding protein aMBF1 (putative translation factor)